jgi:hypothetical protein
MDEPERALPAQIPTAASFRLWYFRPATGAVRNALSPNPSRLRRSVGPAGVGSVARGLRFLPVMRYVMLCRFRCVVGCVMHVALRGVRVMSRNFVFPVFMVCRCFAVVVRREFVMFGCLVMMLCCFLRHGSSSSECLAKVPWPEVACAHVDEQSVIAL